MDGVIRCNLSNKSGSRGSFVFPDSGQLTGLLVVTRETMDTGFNHNKTVLGILVFAVAFKMFANRNGLLDQVVQIFRNFGSKT